MKDNYQLITKLFDFFVCDASILRYSKNCGEKWQKLPNCPKTSLVDVFSQIFQVKSITNKKFKQFWNLLIIIFQLLPLNPLKSLKNIFFSKKIFKNVFYKEQKKLAMFLSKMTPQSNFENSKFKNREKLLFLSKNGIFKDLRPKK